MDIGTLLTTDPAGLGWFGRQLLEPWFKRRSPRAEYQHTTRAQRVQLLVQLLGTLRHNLEWMSGPGGAQQVLLANDRSRGDRRVDARSPAVPRANVLRRSLAHDRDLQAGDRASMSPWRLTAATVTRR